MHLLMPFKYWIMAFLRRLQKQEKNWNTFENNSKNFDMTNTELIQSIRNEIERLKNQLVRGACAAQIEMETNCKEEAYDEVLSFLNAIESEKPMREGLEEELDRFIASGKSVTVDDYGTYKVSYHDFKKVARHFAEWQKEKMMEGAVKGTIYGNGGYTWVVGNIPSQFKYGDKVKIIFVKED